MGGGGGVAQPSLAWEGFYLYQNVVVRSIFKDQSDQS